ncbi:MAG: hypothetical protein NZL90_00415 [Aquificaceae bacterium]|nr:hypothetical protein [Aquificaceae bacterium]
MRTRGITGGYTGGAGIRWSMKMAWGDRVGACEAFCIREVYSVELDGAPEAAFCIIELLIR